MDDTGAMSKKKIDIPSKKYKWTVKNAVLG